MTPAMGNFESVEIFVGQPKYQNVPFCHIRYTVGIRIEARRVR